MAPLPGEKAADLLANFRDRPLALSIRSLRWRYCINCLSYGPAAMRCEAFRANKLSGGDKLLLQNAGTRLGTKSHEKSCRSLHSCKVSFDGVTLIRFTLTPEFDKSISSIVSRSSRFNHVAPVDTEKMCVGINGKSAACRRS